MDRLVKHFDYLLDLHTASFGRINSYYVRADMDNAKTKQLALLQNADIIVHNPPSDGTLRGAADELGIPAITLEIGNPNTFQKKFIKSGIDGIENVLFHLEMLEGKIEIADVKTVICKNSHWLYTDLGGLLSINVDLLDRLEIDQKVATIRDVFGRKLKDYYTKEQGIVIGKSVSPVNQSGGRILHLGVYE
jgi:predicted deacylase